MKLQKKNLVPSILLFLILASLPVLSQATEFDAMVVPSLMDSDMDGWYKIPPNSGPNKNNWGQSKINSPNARFNFTLTQISAMALAQHDNQYAH